MHTVLQEFWPCLTGLKWLHSCSAGLEHLLFPELVNSSVTLTNAKGVYSHSLAEYVAAVLYMQRHHEILVSSADETSDICLAALGVDGPMASAACSAFMCSPAHAQLLPKLPHHAQSFTVSLLPGMP